MGDPAEDIPAHINPAMLTWARERKGMSYADVGTLMGLSPILIANWEYADSADRPTWDQANRLAEILGIGLGHFYLSAPISERDPVPEPIWHCPLCGEEMTPCEVQYYQPGRDGDVHYISTDGYQCPTCRMEILTSDDIDLMFSAWAKVTGEPRVRRVLP